jgi:hypothetical protein
MHNSHWRRDPRCRHLPSIPKLSDSDTTALSELRLGDLFTSVDVREFDFWARRRSSLLLPRFPRRRILSDPRVVTQSVCDEAVIQVLLPPVSVDGRWPLGFEAAMTGLKCHWDLIAVK